MISESPLSLDQGGTIALGRHHVRAAVKAHPRKKGYALDQAAVIFPSTLGRVQHHMYNLSVTLREAVDIACLQAALEKLRLRFPTFMVRLKRELCHYRLETLEKIPDIQQGIRDRLRPMSHKDLSESCVRIQAEGNEISMDCFHAVSDGHGAMLFLKTLLAAYLSIKYGKDFHAEKNLPNADDAPKASEMEDSFLSCPSEGWNTGNLTSKAYKHRGTPVAGQAETAITLDAFSLHEKAKGLGVTIIQYVAGLLLQAGNSLRREKDAPVRIAIPVDLRKHFPSNTMRNFSLGCTVGCNNQSDLRHTCKAVQAQLHDQCSTEALSGSIAAVLRLGKVIRYGLPLLWMKNAVIKLGYSLFGSQSATMAVSNLGQCELPPAMAAYVESVACRSDTNPVDTHCCTLLTFRDKAVIRLGRSIRESTLEDAFCCLLSTEKLPYQRCETGFSF